MFPLDVITESKRVHQPPKSTFFDMFGRWCTRMRNPPPPKSALHMSGLSMLALDRHRRNGYSIESFVVNQRGSPVGIKKKIKKELIGTSDYPSNKIFTISNFITFTRLILTLVFLYLFVTDNNRVIAIAIYALSLIHI